MLAQRTRSSSVRTQPASGQQILMLEEADARSLAVARRDLIVEEDRPLDLYAMPGLPPIMPAVAADAWEVTVTDEAGQPIPDCTVFAVGEDVGFRGDTGEDGKAQLSLTARHVDHVIVSPRRDFWSQVVAPPADGATLKVTLPRLDPVAVTGRMHRLLGLAAFGHPDQHQGQRNRRAACHSGSAQRQLSQAPGPS